MAYFRLLRSFNLPFVRHTLPFWAWTVLAHTADAEFQYIPSYSCIKLQGWIFCLHWQNVWFISLNQFESFKALVLSRVFSSHFP